MFIRGFVVKNNSSEYRGGGVNINNWAQNTEVFMLEDMTITNNRSTNGDAGGLYLENNGEEAVIQNVIVAFN